MRRTILLSGVASFVMAFAGTIAALTIAFPAVVGAQDARIRAEQFTVVGDNGADRVKLAVGPSIGASVQIFSTDGVQRANLTTGLSRVGDDPDASGLNISGPDGRVGVIRLGLGRGPLGADPLSISLFLRDLQGNTRMLLTVAEDGTPTMRMFDADGKVIWSAP